MADIIIFTIGIPPAIIMISWYGINWIFEFFDVLTIQIILCRCAMIGNISCDNGEINFIIAIDFVDYRKKMFMTDEFMDIGNLGNSKTFVF